MAGNVNLSELLARRAGSGSRARLSAVQFRQQEGPADVSPLVRNIYPPWVFKLPMSQDINANQFASVLPAVVGATVTPVTFTIPETTVGWEQIFGIFILSPTALQDITFSLRVNGGPVQGWDNIKFPPGVANFVVQNFADLQVRIPNGGKVDVVVTNNNGAGPFTVGAKIAGWYHPESEEQRIYGTL
ncbi:MAG: hypothetical protein ACRDRF_00665 [Pseudonocardiaceae bacterium]